MNLHPTEQVLSPPPGKHSSDKMNSSDADSELNFTNGRSSSRHSMSRATLAKKQPSRQNSAQVDSKPHPLSRSVTSLTSRGSKPVTSSPRPNRTHSPQTATLTRDQGPAFVIQPSFTLCPSLYPSALETLEAAVTSQYGLTYDAVIENAARAISETAMHMLDNFGGSRRPSRANTARGNGVTSPTMLNDGPALPVIVILAGNHALGARAVAAARHLVCRKTKIIVAEALFDSAETQDVQMQTQTAILRRMMRAGANVKRGPWRKTSHYIKNLTGPPALIIDALLAGSTYESLLDASTQQPFEAQRQEREMIDWANRSRAPVLSVSCPSGVSGIDGSATVVEGEPLAVRPDRILSLGAPLQGLLEAMKNGERWDVSLADIGVNIALRSEEAVTFGAQWVVDLKFIEDGGYSATGETVQA